MNEKVGKVTSRYYSSEILGSFFFYLFVCGRSAGLQVCAIIIMRAVLVTITLGAFPVLSATSPSKGTIPSLASHVSTLASQRSTYSLDLGWKFELATEVNNTGYNCSADTFPNDLSGVQCIGLASQPYVTSGDGCRAVCCGDTSCLVWQWSDDAEACLTGASSNCAKVRLKVI